MALPRIDQRQRRARLGTRHLLAPSTHVDGVEEVADALVAVHATDPATVYLSLAARLRTPGHEPVERALYDDVTLHRLLAMRRTMFVVPADLAPLVNGSTGVTIAARERAKLLTYLADGVGWDVRRLLEVQQAVLEALRARGEATAVQLGQDVPALCEQVVVAAGKPYETKQNVSSRVIRILACDGLIRRARPRGSWISSQFRWTTATPWPDLPIADTQAELARRWLASYGPATVADLKWWTGWSLTATRQALAGMEEVELDGGTGYVVPGDAGPVAEPEPWVALLPGLDSTTMGWRDRDWYLSPAHVPRLFDTMGNAGPTVWCDGRVVGGWAQRADGEIVWTLLDDVGADAEALIAREAATLAGWLGAVRVQPRFRTPLERELSR
ncbi:winged helix DNA-binding domain-containing protein [Umezawaea endophytica]|uniref:Winged helix DNA-binding domain-containing protein n=1 Tax=Umezawaea endophytica TaxID=1654476 RepID=A0A9X2VNA3_9PSEU|nr:winged helix DNA-binding domain-containing protein [Umezawaea endophytica]MCS7479569.1 winged helix DNA-binding domain-containing protein [Umezawaea endophytica]